MSLIDGVPALLNGFTQVASAATLILGDIAGAYLGLPFGQQWGIYLGGAPAVLADSVITFDYRRDSVISDYPLENGTFESYDIVQRPFDVRMRLTCGQDEGTRAAFLAGLHAIEGTTNLFEFMSPEDVFQSVAIAHVDYHRSAMQGAGLLSVDVWGWQIMVQAGSGVQNAASPSGNDPTNSGSLQSTPIGGGPGNVTDPAGYTNLNVPGTVQYGNTEGSL